MRLKLFLETSQKTPEKKMGVTHVALLREGVKVITLSWAWVETS